MPSDEQVQTLIREVSDLKMRVQGIERTLTAMQPDQPRDLGARAPVSDHGASLQQSEDLVRKGKEEQRAEDQIRREEQTAPARD